MRTILAAGCVLALAGLGLLAALGCGALGALQGQDVKKTVKPEYSHLKNHKLAIFVRTQQSTEWADPDLKRDLANYVRKSLEGKLIPGKDGVSGMTFVPAGEIERYQVKNLRWAETPDLELARKFKTEMALFIEVQYYALGDPEQSFSQRGRLSAKCSLYDLDESKKAGGEEKVWEKGTRDQFTVEYPPKDYTEGINTTSKNIRSKLLELFAEKLTDCFRDHEEPYYER
jgi:hypothetical protein